MNNYGITLKDINVINLVDGHYHVRKRAARGKILMLFLFQNNIYELG